MLFFRGLNDKETSIYLKSYESGLEKLKQKSQVEKEFDEELENDMAIFALFNTQENYENFNDDDERAFINNLATQNEALEENDQIQTNAQLLPEETYRDVGCPLEVGSTAQVGVETQCRATSTKRKANSSLSPGDNNWKSSSSKRIMLKTSASKDKQHVVTANTRASKKTMSDWDDIFSCDDVKDQQCQEGSSQSPLMNGSDPVSLGDVSLSDDALQFSPNSPIPVCHSPIDEICRSSSDSDIKKPYHKSMCYDFKLNHVSDEDSD